MLTDLHPWLTPILVAAAAWFVRQALSFQQYLDRWVRALDSGEEDW